MLTKHEQKVAATTNIVELLSTLLEIGHRDPKCICIALARRCCKRMTRREILDWQSQLYVTVKDLLERRDPK